MVALSIAIDLVEAFGGHASVESCTQGITLAEAMVPCHIDISLMVGHAVNDDFVKAVCRDFNQIRQGSRTSLLLVVYGGEMSHVAAIDLNYSVKDNFWEIKTASPRNSEAVKRKPLVWEGAHPSGGNGYRPY